MKPAALGVLSSSICLGPQQFAHKQFPNKFFTKQRVNALAFGVLEILIPVQWSLTSELFPVCRQSTIIIWRWHAEAIFRPGQIPTVCLTASIGSIHQEHLGARRHMCSQLEAKVRTEAGR